VIETQLQAARVVLAVMTGRSLTAALTDVRRHTHEEASPGAIQDIAFGVFRHLGLLRGVLACSLTQPLADRDLEALVLVALYQLQFSRAAPHAVVDHAVRACGKLRKSSAKGLVNAVLRRFLRESDALLSRAQQTDEGRWSYPQWWIDEIRRTYPRCYGTILVAGNLHPPMTLRVNLTRMSRDEYADRLREQGVETEAIGDAALMLARPLQVESLPGFREGLVSVQDLAAQYAAPLLDLHAGQRVLDACAAPGGKAAHIVESARVELTAVDSDAGRLERVQETLQRLRLPASLVHGDASEPRGWWDGAPFDRILLDAPCTASGIVRRHPDIKWLRRPNDLAVLAERQSRLLRALWHTLAAGGKLLYATCSIFSAENQLQIAAFLQSHPEAKALPLSIPDCSGIEDIRKIANTQGQLLPDPRHDGFFYALLQKD
jgi:16S rRNA (cytosine967-C5)-methyltransferase